MFGFCVVLVPCAAGAEPLFAGADLAAPKPPSDHSPNLRLFAPAFPSAPSRRFSGMIVGRELAPGAQLGLGLLSSSKRSSGFDGRSEKRKSRKLGLSFRLQF
jgi:hypothetical protein